MRKYKNLDKLISLFSDALPHEDAHLVIAGAYKDKLFDHAQSSHNITLHLSAERIEEKEFCRFMRTSHYCILPYQKSLTSGVLLYALSCGTPVIAPNTGHYKAVLSPDTAFLYDENDPSGLADAIKEACAISKEQYQRMRQNAYDTALAYPWSQTAQLLFSHF